MLSLVYCQLSRPLEIDSRIEFSFLYFFFFFVNVLFSTILLIGLIFLYITSTNIALEVILPSSRLRS